MSEQLQILLYSPNLPVRLNYIASTILGDTLNFTNSKETFIAFDGFKINYSATRINDEYLHIVPHGLLEQTKIEPQFVECFEWNGITVFFKTDGDIPFDFFAASFYLLTRYEEYLPNEKDEYGRFKHENSIAYQHNFLHQPLIQLWLAEISRVYPRIGRDRSSWIMDHGQIPPVDGPRSTVHRPPFSFIPTYDIDIAYSYLHHSAIRNVLGYFKDLSSGKINTIAERMQVLSGAQKDPYDIYEWLNFMHSSLQLQPIYFFLMAQKRMGNDKNILPNSTALQQLIKQQAALGTVGIHPSIQSNQNLSILIQEHSTLQKVTTKPVIASRQHYIQMELPITYKRLIEAGITHDYSMGYPRANGFRASYAAPFFWFDVTENKSTNLLIHSFCYMDATAIFQERITVTQAAEQLQYHFDTVKKVGGEFIPVMHNNFLTMQPNFVAWRNMYADFLLRNCLH